ncbi:diacylglycerol kinase family protein [Pseudoalteromonas rubra]|uniref:Diacylglycerol kinase n=1 Tax=Pseudoalteromonas rubra TaxID=43658 RepID=A0A5S3X3S6_9GAMM|nr:diacylglycerol kinase family protein [Pseudoalteromonas rubra]TMP38451.1 hypothetical protein CWB98_06890 [Pseudoalteromonas rubra]
MSTAHYYLVLLLFTLPLIILNLNNLMLLPSIWLSASIACVYVAYALDRPGLFRKRTTGQVPFYIKALLLPYFIGAQLYNAWQRYQDSVPPVQEVKDNLFLACRLFPSDIPMLQSKQVDAILDVTAEFDGLNWSAEEQGLYYLNIPILDHQTPSETQLRHALNWITVMHQLNKKVVVHCALGRGRSVFVVAAYLMLQDPSLSVDDAMQFINSKRQTARLNRYQHHRLKALMHDLRDTPGSRLDLIINPVSGGGKWHLYDNQVIGLLCSKYTLVLHFTEQDTDVAALAVELSQDAERLIACGGDGTLTAVAHALVNSECKLGFIPLGTANALAHVLLGIRSKVDPISSACEVLLSEHYIQIDTMTCNGETGLLVAAFGFEAQMIEHANRGEKNRSGQLAYISGFINAVSDGQKQRVTLRIDNQPAQSLDIASLAVANAAPITTVLAQGGGEPDYQDGLLDLTLIHHEPESASRALSVAQLIATGVSGPSATQESAVSHTRCQRVTLHADSEQIQYSIDGEVKSADSLNIEVNQASLWIMAPESTHSS